MVKKFLTQSKAKSKIDTVVTPVVKPIRKRKPKNPNQEKFYVQPKQFLEDITEYYKTDVISDRLAQSINKIAEGLSYAPNFINYTYKDDFIGDAIVKMVAALMHKKFRIDSGFNPFAYFTTIAFHAFINRIKKEKKHHQALADYQDHVYTELLNSNSTAPTNIYVDPNNHSGDDHGD